ncbi:MAG TPA: cupin [Hellea balneolensis]|uniref:Cupin n=1 Tax=Hellea balneolensis TaxID=287478 RepID=A0A7C3C9Z9_9PROT|nr:cupin [Hellea balneolensis]
MELNADLRMPASAKFDELCWTLSPQKGVRRKMLERVGGEHVSRATSIVRYAAGSSFYDHTHDGGEEFLVLDGTFSDASGDFPQGWYVRNPPGSSHAPFSKDGCVIFVKLGQFHRFDRRAVRKDTSCANADWCESENGTKTLRLFEGAHEHVSLVKWPAGLKLEPSKFSSGLEIFVISGRFVDEFGDHKLHDWLRIPAGFGHAPRAIEDTMLYIKTGHLSVK